MSIFGEKSLLSRCYLLHPKEMRRDAEDAHWAFSQMSIFGKNLRNGKHNKRIWC